VTDYHLRTGAGLVPPPRQRLGMAALQAAAPLRAGLWCPADKATITVGSLPSLSGRDPSRLLVDLLRGALLHDNCLPADRS
jgi:hypothetical protein